MTKQEKINAYINELIDLGISEQAAQMSANKKEAEGFFGTSSIKEKIDTAPLLALFEEVKMVVSMIDYDKYNLSNLSGYFLLKIGNEEGKTVVTSEAKITNRDAVQVSKVFCFNKLTKEVTSFDSWLNFEKSFEEQFKDFKFLSWFRSNGIRVPRSYIDNYRAENKGATNESIRTDYRKFCETNKLPLYTAEMFFAENNLDVIALKENGTYISHFNTKIDMPSWLK